MKCSFLTILLHLKVLRFKDIVRERTHKHWNTKFTKPLTIQRVCFAFDQMADVEIFTCIDFSMCNAHFTSNNILIRVVLLVTSIHAECDSYANDYASRKCSFYLHVHLLTIIFCSSAYILTLTILCIGWIQKLSIRYGVYIFQFRTE